MTSYDSISLILNTITVCCLVFTVCILWSIRRDK